MSAVTSILDRRVTVCDECLQASCWHGIFLCDRANGAGTVKRTVRELRELDYENPCYWFRDPNTGRADPTLLSEYEALAKTPRTTLAQLQEQNAQYLSALRGCVEHMEWATPQGKEAFDAAVAALPPNPLTDLHSSEQADQL